MRLKDKVSIVTGAARGLGKACALEMAREGAILAVNDFDEQQLLQTVEEIEKLARQIAAMATLLGKTITYAKQGKA